jgi:hypothetical protein
MLTTREARHLRRADSVMRSLVAHHPWADAVTPVRRLIASWRSSFPAATAMYLDAPKISKAQLATLSGLLSFTITGHGCQGYPDNEFPLAAVRCMRHSHTLRVTRAPLGRGAAEVHIAPGAAVWLELGRLQELSLSARCSGFPANLLQLLGGRAGPLRKLELELGGLEVHDAGFSITDPGLASLPLSLKSLSISGIMTAGAVENGADDFTGEGLAALTGLESLALLGGVLPTGILAHVAPTLLSLDVSDSRPITDESFAHPALTHLRSLTLHGAPSTLTAAALAGLNDLEELDYSVGPGSALMSDAWLQALGSLRNLRRLCCDSNDYSVRVTYAGSAEGSNPGDLRLASWHQRQGPSGGGLGWLSQCPRLEELVLTGRGNEYFPAFTVGAVTSLRSLHLSSRMLFGAGCLSPLSKLVVR